MHPLFQYKLKHQNAHAHTAGGTPELPDAPAPWRTVSYLSELDEILDANGFTVAVCQPKHAARIIAAVNGVEKVS